MKKTPLILALSLALGSAPLLAQNWVNGGNTLSTTGRFGANSNQSVIFETNNNERGRLTGAGLWGFGTSTPNAKVTVNSPAGLSPFRVQLNGSTKFLVNGKGGVSIGAAVLAPVDGLYVKGQVGIGVVTPESYYKLDVVNSDSTIYNYGIRGKGDVGIRGEGLYEGVVGVATSLDPGPDYSYADGIGVAGYSSDGEGVYGSSNVGYGGYFTSDLTALYATSWAGWAAYFAGDVYAAGTYQSSDQNLKKNIREVGNALSIINQLKPKHYEFRDDGNYASLHLPKGNHYGLLAQDVEAVLPNLVKESTHEIRDKETAQKFTPDGKLAMRATQKEGKESMKIKAVNYTEFIPLLIKAVQEQQQTIQELQKGNLEQQQTISTLTDKIAKLEAGNTLSGDVDRDHARSGGASLAQNQPNPFNQTTTFRYTVPAGASAQILIYDGLSGALLKTVPAPASGQAELNGHDLKAGTYIYSLVVNGKQVDSKKMVLSK